ncbi:MAG: hypothetical protein SFX18_02550 [Pirellulales bacterium]|nr:hypothetical protein [Pirellulales bacterium]
MKPFRFLNPYALAPLIIGIAIAGYFSRAYWLPQTGPRDEANSAVPTDESSVTATKIIVGDQAQKNLKLTAKQVMGEPFWKSMTVPGMVVDRPGVSDREIVAPAIGTISHIAHLPGDTVRRGDLLFTLKLASESFQQTQTELFNASQNIELATARRKRMAAKESLQPN